MGVTVIAVGALPAASGIYVIQNAQSRKFYVGSTKSLRARFTQHLGELRRGVHYNRHLQASFKKYGAACFRFWVAELCGAAALLSREQWWLDMFRPSFNVMPLAGPRGSFSAEHRASISAAKKGKALGPMSDAAREAHRLAALGHETADATRLKISESHRRLAAKAREKALQRGTKRCPACRAFLPFVSFHKDSRRLLGLQSLCKRCARARLEARRLADA